jgi:hypothetical protein
VSRRLLQDGESGITVGSQIERLLVRDRGLLRAAPSRVGVPQRALQVRETAGLEILVKLDDLQHVGVTGHRKAKAAETPIPGSQPHDERSSGDRLR